MREPFEPLLVTIPSDGILASKHNSSQCVFGRLVAPHHALTKIILGGSHILKIHDETLAISESRTTITHNTKLRTLVISKNIVATMMKNCDESSILAQIIRTNARTAHVQNVDYT